MWATDKQQTGTKELLPNSIMASAATVGGGMQAWQHPFCDLFKHVDVDKWQQSDRAGNVTKVLVSPWPAHLSRPCMDVHCQGASQVGVFVCVCVLRNRIKALASMHTSSRERSVHPTISPSQGVCCCCCWLLPPPHSKQTAEHDSPPYFDQWPSSICGHLNSAWRPWVDWSILLC